MEGEITPHLGNAKKNDKGEYEKDDIQKASSAKGIQADKVVKDYKDGWKLLDQVYKNNQLLKQSIETIGKEIGGKKETSILRDISNQKNRENEANKYKAEKAFEAMVESASIEELKNLYKQAQEALEKAMQSGSKKDIQEAEKVAEKVKGALEGKQDAADKMSKEIDDIIAKALKDKRLNKKNKQGLIEMQEMLKKAASDGNLDTSELQQLAPYVDAAAKSSEGIKEYVTQMGNATIDMAKSQADRLGDIESHFAKKAKHLQDQLDAIKRSMKKSGN